MTPAPTATLRLVAVVVECGACGSALFQTPSTPVDSTPWGEAVPCWACRKPVTLPPYPFPARPRR